MESQPAQGLRRLGRMFTSDPVVSDPVVSDPVVLFPFPFALAL